MPQFISRIKPVLSLLFIPIMVFMVCMTLVFIYSSLSLKDKITLRIAHQTERLTSLVTRSALDLMRGGHSAEKYTTLLGYGELAGVDEVAIFKTDGREAFSGLHHGSPDSPGRFVSPAEKSSFNLALDTASSSVYYNRDTSSYSRFVPLTAKPTCMKCHHTQGEVLGVLMIRLYAEGDHELIGYVQRLSWSVGGIVLLPIGALLVAWSIIRDKNRIHTQLKETNASIRRTYNELDETRYHLQMILDNSRVIIITTDTQGRIVEFNHEAGKILEYAKEEVVGTDVLMLYDEYDNLRPVRRGEPIGEVWEARNREVTLRSKSGKVFHVSMTLSTMVDKDGRIIGTVGVGKDISEQKMLRYKLLQSEKLAGIGTLASGIAHEINNPLAGILGMAEAIQEEDDMDTIRAYTEDIIRYADNAHNIVKQLSTYSRSAQNEPRTAVDLSVRINEALRMARHSHNNVQIQIVKDLDEDCLINANQVEIQQIFVNLIVNAMHALDEKGTLTLRCRKEGTFVVASVSDTGSGISEEDFSQIYDPFFTTKPVGKGTGLGLYVVYRLVTKHSGTIDVESKAGEGTTFTLKFPHAESSAEDGSKTLFDRASPE